jgi:hypothetical protein
VATGSGVKAAAASSWTGGHTIHSTAHLIAAEGLAERACADRQRHGCRLVDDCDRDGDDHRDAGRRLEHASIFPPATAREAGSSAALDPGRSGFRGDLATVRAERPGSRCDPEPRPMGRWSRVLMVWLRASDIGRNAET